MLANIWKRRRNKILFLLLLSSICFCSKQQENRLASVGSSSLYLSQVDTLWVENGRVRDYTEQWIEDELFFREAREQDLHHRQDIKREIREAERQILVQAYVENYIRPRVTVSDSEITEYYQEHTDDYTASEKLYRIKLLYLPEDSFNASLAESLADSLKENPALFDSFVVRYSDNSFQQNSDLGYLSQDELPSFVVDNLRKLRYSKVVGPMKSEFGFYFIKLDGIKEKGEVLELEQVRPIIRSQIYTQKFDSLIDSMADSLKQIYQVSVNDSLLDEL